MGNENMSLKAFNGIAHICVTERLGKIYRNANSWWEVFCKIFQCWKCRRIRNYAKNYRSLFMNTPWALWAARMSLFYTKHPPSRAALWTKFLRRKTWQLMHNLFKERLRWVLFGTCNPSYWEVGVWGLSKARKPWALFDCNSIHTSLLVTQ